MNVKVRIAPSPTGFMHVGTAQSALFNWLFARRHGGEFFLRIEDTDQARNRPEYETSILEGLRWLGLDWDNAELYRQSERTAVYRKYLERLLESGKAFWRQTTQEERAALAKDGRVARDQVIVLKDEGDPERELTFDDLIRGPVSFQVKNVLPLVLAKSLDEPLYHFAVVVDDIEMEITHVLRGEDHISNTPKHMLIYEALGAALPRFGHLPLMLGADRSKLSKRNGDVSLASYQKDYLPEAFINFLGSLSYAFEPEMLTPEEMLVQFDLPKVHRSGAIFDLKKLNWFNAQYIRLLKPAVFKNLIGRPDLPDAAVPIITERLERLSDADQFAYLWQAPEVDPSLLPWKGASSAETAQALQAILKLSEPLSEESLNQLTEREFDGQKGRVYWPLRVALSGQKNSAGPTEIAGVLGSELVRARLEAALEKCQ